MPGACVPEAASTPCGAATFCSDGAIFPQGACDGSGTCVSDTDVPCSPYTQCDGDACATTCDIATDCDDGFYCDNADHCVAQGDPGDACDAGAECLSGFCVGHVCCASASCPACQTCASGACAADASQNREVCDGSGATTSICCNGSCWDGCCDADGEPGACLAFLTGPPTLSGDLDGLAGADATCQARADANDLPGDYTAWLSTGSGANESPATGRFRQSGQPYQRVDDVTIAADWDGLISGSLQHPLNVTETGAVISGNTFVWTNTLTDGTVGGSIPGSDCSDWTDGSSAIMQGNIGNSGQADSLWSEGGSSACELGFSYLYCFQQR